MPSNIELKARDADPARTRALAEQISDTPAVELKQEDTFYSCPNGRLKLRRISPAHSELIFYRRPDVPGPKQSEYLIVPVTAPERLDALLTAAFGAGRTVVKTRVLFHVGQTRIHLDKVKGLGSFVEFEVVLRERQSPQEGHQIALDLMARLGVREEDLIEGAYADLLAAAKMPDSKASTYLPSAMQ
jgi:predicted adenylyl cyclase CyaB